jgi:hypothetical protein
LCRDAGVWFGLGFRPRLHRTAPQVWSGSGCGPQKFLEVQFRVHLGVHTVQGILCTWSEPDCTLNLGLIKSCMLLYDHMTEPNIHTSCNKSVCNVDTLGTQTPSTLLFHHPSIEHASKPFYTRCEGKHQFIVHRHCSASACPGPHCRTVH